MKYYPSESKKDRAASAIANYNRESAKHPDKAEYKLVGEGLGKKLEGEALLDFVYSGLGGASALEGAEAKEAEEKSEKAKARRVKRAGAATKRSKISVK